MERHCFYGTSVCSKGLDGAPEAPVWCSIVSMAPQVGNDFIRCRVGLAPGSTQKWSVGGFSEKGLGHCRHHTVQPLAFRQGVVLVRPLGLQCRGHPAAVSKRIF